MDVCSRRGEARDYAATRKLVHQTFLNEGAKTAAFLDALRADGCVLGEWIAEDPTGFVGHIVFSRVRLEQGDGVLIDGAMLTPLAVRADRQRQGIGLRLMRHALGELEAQGETLFFVLGHPSYYPRAGFSAASAVEVESRWSGKPAFMARAQRPLKGRLVLPRAIEDAH
jgi:putative acetyltransferase